MSLIIDAGHGGNDGGASANGYVEKDLNLIVARRVRELLKDYNPAMTRNADITLSSTKRTDIIRNKYSHCISIHFNAGGGTGTEAIHSIYSSNGKRLGELMVDELNKETGIPIRRVFSRKNTAGGDYYFMHRLTGNTMTVIIEVGFLDSNDHQYFHIEKISRAIANSYIKFIGGTSAIPTPTVPTVSNPRTIREFDSNVHVFETSKDMIVDVDLGVRRQLERVSKIVGDKLNAGEKILCGINAGFFNLSGTSEHLGLLIDDGLYYTPPSHSFVDFIYWKDGTTEIVNMDGYDQKVLSDIQRRSNWAIGTSYALVIDGEINLMNNTKFDHWNSRQPRTMIGQKADGTFVLAVVDGRSTNSLGVTAQQQAQIMLKLGCINAVNLDGGGSSTMVRVVNGTPVVHNRPSDGNERAVGSVILVKEA